MVQLLAQDELGSLREEPDEDVSQDYRTAFAAIHNDPDNQLVVGEINDEVVCMLQLTFLPHLSYRGGWRAQIEEVRVASDWRGQGVGGELIRWAVGKAHERGCHLVQLTSSKERQDALRFYESLGFAATHEGMKLYLSGDATGRRS